MKFILDPKSGEYLRQCPECGETIRLSSQAAVGLAMRAGRCQGCRAGLAFKRNPGLAGLFIDFWARANTWPQSDSWMDSMPESGIAFRVAGVH
jgi:hypothetical protein